MAHKPDETEATVAAGKSAKPLKPHDIRRPTATDLFDRKHSLFTYGVWALLMGSAGISVWTQNWNQLFLAITVFGLTLLPFFFESWADVRLPKSFIGAVVFFIFGTIFLGEIGDFYERFTWWDTLLHTGSAIGFAMIGTVVMLFFVRGDRLRAPALLLAIMAFAFAVSIGAVWEIYEFAMDQFFGMNMQKSGLVDTMEDLIVDVIGAAIGAGAGYWYLKRGGKSFLPRTIDQFIKDNPHMFDDADQSQVEDDDLVSRGTSDTKR
ncbi:hypothetical protein GCM10009069_15240 [Algimonas arctica]|uniref:Uncharacterized protein n=1 Tax=Algimonas arctica TaxID=1479486 RepID=A0A8J3CSL9_9PROT|nr:hypothetical protein [Algimonas arctica]GHA93150.1 hypothetical protein GCM10009069_15240 [Algimonas arctica]